MAFYWNSQYGFMFLGVGVENFRLGISLNDNGQIAGISQKGYWLYQKGSFSKLDVKGKLIKLRNDGRILEDDRWYQFGRIINSNDYGDIISSDNVSNLYLNQIKIEGIKEADCVAINNYKIITGFRRKIAAEEQRELIYFPLYHYFTHLALCIPRSADGSRGLILRKILLLI